ncbi:MAG: molybdopterin-synthase adenylyltransferase MoeB [Rhodobacteraceae bacterium]|nr:molybdopterin-synthase adenylyltransferase MoeB [Paracoccaceae bacterium]
MSAACWIAAFAVSASKGSAQTADAAGGAGASFPWIAVGIAGALLAVYIGLIAFLRRRARKLREHPMYVREERVPGRTESDTHATNPLPTGGARSKRRTGSPPGNGPEMETSSSRLRRERESIHSMGSGGPNLSGLQPRRGPEFDRGSTRKRDGERPRRRPEDEHQVDHPLPGRQSVDLEGRRRPGRESNGRNVARPAHRATAPKRPKGQPRENASTSGQDLPRSFARGPAELWAGEEAAQRSEGRPADRRSQSLHPVGAPADNEVADGESMHAARPRTPPTDSLAPTLRPREAVPKREVAREAKPAPVAERVRRDEEHEAEDDDRASTNQALSKHELRRYSRHIILREIGGVGQARLKNGSVLVVGAGGLGSPALLYLNAAGVGNIGIVDKDEVAMSNLQRQVIHDSDRVGSPKVYSALVALGRQNPRTRIKPHELWLDRREAHRLIPQYGLVLDGSDNFETRQIVNEVCVERGVPLVYAAITQWEGQVGVYLPGGGVPCYACLFDKMPAPETVPSCAEAGVLSALPGVLGTMMAVEAIKVLAMAGKSLAGRLIIYDALNCEFTPIQVKPNPNCLVCQREPHSS